MKDRIRNRRLLLIPAWFVAQYVWDLFPSWDFVGALEAMTSPISLMTSLLVIVVIVLWANKYQVVFEDDDTSPRSK